MNFKRENANITAVKEQLTKTKETETATEKREWAEYIERSKRESQEALEEMMRAAAAQISNSITAEQEDSLLSAIETGNGSRLERLCKEYNITLNVDGSYFLEHVVVESPELVSKALALGADASARNSMAYRIAVDLNRKNAAKKLLEHGADPDAIKKYGHSAFRA